MFFTVIIPAYNRASQLKATIDSVLDQTFVDFELILVDDGSTDNTRAVLEQISRKDNRVRYIYQNNQERCIARNTGIKHAKADWICFLDSDDFYKANHLETLHKLIMDHPGRKAFATAISGASIANPNEVKILSFRDFRNTNNLNLAQLCFNKKEFPFVTFPEERMRLGEDLYFIRKLTLETDILQSPVITVYKNDEADRTDARIKKPYETASEFVEATTKFVEAHSSKIAPPDKSRMLSFAYLVAANILIATNNKLKGIRFLKEAILIPASYTHLSLYKALVKILYK